jgi:AraC family transcriptional regulator
MKAVYEILLDESRVSIPCGAVEPQCDLTEECHFRAVRRVIAAFQDKPDRNISLQDMARVALISRFYFNRIFHKLTGVRPRVFQRAVRMQQAKRMLLDTKLRVTEICFEAGYNSLGTFIRSFTKLVGSSPTRFRQVASSFYPPDCSSLNNCNASAMVSQIRVRARTPIGFSGPVFNGLFTTPVPEGRPVACALTWGGNGDFGILSNVATGTYYLCSAALPESATASSYVMSDPVLVGRTLVEVHSALVDQEIEIVLRPMEVTDPPLVTSLAELIETGRVRTAAA